MSRVSRAQAEENRASVVTTAARLFRERGIHGVSLADLMNTVGLTHGGFYKQFASKDALVKEATAQAFMDRGGHLADLDRRYPGHAEARRAMVEEYLSPEHRDEPGTGCPTAGFVGDMAHAAYEGNVSSQTVFADGVRRFADWMADGDDDDGLAVTCTLLGAILLARAASSTDLSDEILKSVRRSIVEDVV